MRKKLVAIGGLIVALLFVVLLTRAVGHKVVANNLCKDFIVGIEQGNSDATYQQFSPRLQKLISMQEWRDQVAAVRGHYGATVPQLKTRSSQTVGSQTYTKEVYFLNNASGPYTLTCTVTNTKAGDRIDSFTSQIND